MTTCLTRWNHIEFVERFHLHLMDLISSRHTHRYNIPGSVVSDPRRNNGTVFHRYSGRIGNQLFQYAAVTEIARQNNMDTCIRDYDELPLSTFFEGLGGEESCDSAQPFNYRNELSYAGWEAFELPGEDIVLNGAFQSYKYIDPELRTRLRMKPLIANQAKSLIETFPEHVLVGIHVRRYEATHLRIPTEQYFKNAMQHFEDKFFNVGFVIVSDDVNWCNQQDFLKKDNVHIVSVNPPALDLALLIECDHMILSVGTFGWWGAYLGADARVGGECVYYDSEFVEDSVANIGNVQVANYYPPNWISLGNSISALPRDVHTRETSALLLGDATIVTAYFEFPSKHSSEEYHAWMQNMLSLQDPMVIFTSADKESEIYRMRAHATNRTLVVVTSLEETEVVRLYGMEFWRNQRLIDPEKNIHRTHKLYIVWASKVSFVQNAITLNPFKSSYFVWVDMGCFRQNGYNGEWMVNDATPFKGDRVLALDVTLETRHVVYDLFLENDNRMGGGIFGGSITAMQMFYTQYYKTLNEAIASHSFVGKEQPLFWNTCKREKELCHMITPDPWFYSGEMFFYLQPYLFNRLWKFG